ETLFEEYVEKFRKIHGHRNTVTVWVESRVTELIGDTGKNLSEWRADVRKNAASACRNVVSGWNPGNTGIAGRK
ncbi:hypothetical protein, partial [Thiolapillus sp.]|uniref:hypothetical protein n=1 Tax=Thiolapillus sp. TaxID=2017437 RepID=UPI003AF64214